MARILVVDDDPDILKLTRQLLATQEHDVFVANNAREAVQILKENPLDLIISDANMPVFSGYDFVKSLKKDPKYKNIPVTFLTGRKERKDIDDAIEAGVVDYIVKPLDPLLFLQKINSILQKNSVEEPYRLSFSENDPKATAFVGIEAKLQSISELGVVFICKQGISENQKIQFSCATFDEIGIRMPYLKVLSCTNSNHTDFPYALRLQFYGVRDADLQKVRAWIHKQTMQQRKKAA